jgi:hypothetical protein
MMVVKTSRGLFLTGEKSGFMRILLDDHSLVGKIAQTSSGRVAGRVFSISLPLGLPENTSQPANFDIIFHFFLLLTSLRHHWE